jgi:hypothetical protein
VILFDPRPGSSLVGVAFGIGGYASALRMSSLLSQSRKYANREY